MKIALLTLIYSLSVLASFKAQLGTGSLTPHFSGSKKNYCNQWNNTGIIVNKTYYLTLHLDNIGITYLKGNDSICSEIDGLFFEYIFSRTKWNEFGVTVGGYAYNPGNWEKHAEKTPSGINAPEPVTTKYFGRDVVPVLALSWGIHLIRGDNWSLRLNNLFTPVIFNHSIAYEYRF